MSIERVEVLIVGGGQAGIAMSEHLSGNGIDHLVLERYRIAERWRTARWDSLVANGPAWHDRFPNMEFAGDPDGFPGKDEVADYMVAYAQKIAAPIRCGVEVREAAPLSGQQGFRIETSTGAIESDFLVAATGPFQIPVVPGLVPADVGIMQIHSADYRNPAQLPDGAVLVVGAGSSGVQIADELQDSGRRVFLSVGPHGRPPRRYRGQDFCWWLGVLNKWDAEAVPGVEHTTIAVSGAKGGRTIDLRHFAANGMTLLGRTEAFRAGKLLFADDLSGHLAKGDADYLALLDEADAFVARKGLDLPEEPEARAVLPDPRCVTDPILELDEADAFVARKGLDLPEEPEARAVLPDPRCVTDPILELDLAEAGVASIVWATGYSADYSWLKGTALDGNGRPLHQRGVSSEPGMYFLGLPWQTRRGSSFIWGVWHDARYVADHIAKQRAYLAYKPVAMRSKT